MKIGFLGGFPTSVLLYQHLVSTKMLIVVFVQETTVINPRYRNTLIQQFESDAIPYVFLKKGSEMKQLEAFLTSNPVDLMFVCGCTKRIPPVILELPSKGFLNIHFGSLPDNRGADPVFWSLQKQEKYTAITIHKMDTEFDTGAILVTQAVPVHFGETWGILFSKLSFLAVEALKKALVGIENHSEFILQDNLELYQEKPKLEDLTINWENQTTDEIESLVNACNPKYIGARTFFQDGEVHLLEVSPVDSQTPLFGKTSGEIIHAHPQEGLYVCGKYGQLLRLNILKTDAGVLTGTKYVAMGVQIGQRFTTNSKFEKNPNNTLTF